MPSQDHKRLKDNDTGPLTGGMGAYCPCPIITPSDSDIVLKTVLQRAVDGLRADGIEYKGLFTICINYKTILAMNRLTGILYAGMMLTSSGPKVLEFNCRFGDPETQVILPLLKSDLFKTMMACCKNELAQESLLWAETQFAVGVVMASRDYPESSTKGCIINGS